MDNPGYTNDDGKKSADVKVPVTVPDTGPDKPYSGMGKEDLLRFSDTPFWNNLRFACIIIFWLGWAALLASVVGLTVVAPRCEEAPARTWWQKSVMYQIYVRSFYDSGDDGVGDLKGVAEKLDYLSDLNVDTVILSSFYKSREEEASVDDSDFGYDVVDHMAIGDAYGNMADFDMLLNATHRRDMKLVVDFIPNHTGKEHEWFNLSSQATSSADPYYNYYIWAGTPGNVPNNWLSRYEGEAWVEDGGAARNQYYMFDSLKNQPKLNLRSGAVRDELQAILRFWLDKGVDGFRVNSAKYLFVDYDLRNEEDLCQDNPGDTSYDCRDHKYTTGLPEIHDIVASWRTILREYDQKDGRERVLITDADDDLEKVSLYYGTNGRDGASFPLNYQLTKLDSPSTSDIRTAIMDWIGMANNVTFSTSDWMTGTQDLPRMSSRGGADYATIYNMLKLTLPGATVTYYGEELGMMNGLVNGSDIKDPIGKLDPDWGRDNYRTPMQWNDTDNAGFTTGTPWLPVNEDWDSISVEVQVKDEFSTLSVYKRLAEHHLSNTAFHYGNIHFDDDGDNNKLIAYVREYDGTDRFLVVLNFGTENAEYKKSLSIIPGSAECIVTSHPADDMDGFKEGDNKGLGNVNLKPGQGAVFKWDWSR